MHEGHWRTVLAVVVLAAAVGGIEARPRKGDELLAEGRKAEQSRQWDRALEIYERALAGDPGNAAYRIAVQRVRFEAAQHHVDLGRRLRTEGRTDDALAEFERARAIDPASTIAEQEIRRTAELVASSPKPEDRGLTLVEQAGKQELETISRIGAPPQLVMSPRAPINLKMFNQPPRVLFETVGKLAGINVVFDPDYGIDPQSARRNASVDLVNSRLEDALDYVATTTRSFWKPLSANTIFITQDSQAKRREYEDSAVRVFYLTNLTTPQDLQEVSTAVRTLANIQKVFLCNAVNAMLVRGSPDQILLAEKLVNDLDRPRPEVVVDVLVLEANRTKTRNLAATLADASGTAGLSAPITFSPRNAVSSSSSSTTTSSSTTSDTSSTTSRLISLARIAKVSTNDFSITLPGALLQAVVSDRSTRVLQSPQVRAVNGQKASLKIGDRVPIASGGVQTGVGTTTGYASLYNQFQFIDVGVNVDITPTVHGDGEVTLKIMLDISNVESRVDIAGVSQPIIGQRKVEHEIRIRQGEASLLGGLLQEQDTKTKGGVPGLASVPGIGRLFSSDSVEHDRSELLIALIPHVVRTAGITELNLRTIGAGTDQNVRLSLTPKEPAQPAKTPAP